MFPQAPTPEKYRIGVNFHSSLGFGGVYGFALALCGQPAHVLRVRRQAADFQVPYRDLARRIVTQEGYQGFWNALPLALASTVAAQGFKSLAYSRGDRSEAHPFFKAIFVGFMMSLVSVPFDRVSNVLITHSSLPKRQVIMSILSFGPAEFFKGFTPTFSRNLVEASMIFGLRNYYLKKQELEEGKAASMGLGEGLCMTFAVAGVKVVTTNFMDVSRVEIQKHLSQQEKAITMRKVLDIKGAKHFFFAGLVPNLLLNIMSIGGHFIWINYSRARINEISEDI